MKSGVSTRPPKKKQEGPWAHCRQRNNVGWSNCCIEGTGISIRILAGRFAAGEPLAEIAHDMSITRVQLEQAFQLWMRSAGGFGGDKVERKMRETLRAVGRADKKEPW